MEARLQRVETDVVDIRKAVQVVQTDVHQVKETVAVLEDRQARLHKDIVGLTQALDNASGEVSKLNAWVNKRGAFFAGVTFVVGIMASIVTGILAIMKDWYAG